MSYTRPVGVRELRQKVGVGTAVNVSRRTCLPVEIIVVVDRPVDAYLILGLGSRGSQFLERCGQQHAFLFTVRRGHGRRRLSP